MAQKIQRKPQIDQTMKKIFKSNFQPKYGYFGKTMCTVVAIQGDFRPKKIFWPKKKFFFSAQKKKKIFFWVRLSDSGGKSVIYTLQARQTAPCGRRGFFFSKKKKKKKDLSRPVFFFFEKKNPLLPKKKKKKKIFHTLKSRGVTGSLAKNQKKRTPRECFFGFESFRECFFFFYGEFSRLIATKFAINPRE